MFHLFVSSLLVGFLPSVMSFDGGGDGGGDFKKGPWTPAEDALLIDYINKNGPGNWNAVQKNSGLNRCGKSCRLRWTNHLRPDLKKGSFTAEEEETIMRLHQQCGNKWARIAKHLPGRTDNEIKNYWNTRIKRQQRARHSYKTPPIEEIGHPNQSSSQTNINTNTTGWNHLSDIGHSHRSHAPTPTNNWNFNPLPPAYYNNFTYSVTPPPPRYVASQDGIQHHQATQYHVVAHDNVNHPATHYVLGEDGIHRQAPFMPMPIRQDSSSCILPAMEADHAHSLDQLPSGNSGQPSGFWKESNVMAHLLEREGMLASTSNANNVNDDDENWEQSYGIGGYLNGDEGEYGETHADSVGTKMEGVGAGEALMMNPLEVEMSALIDSNPALPPSTELDPVWPYHNNNIHSSTLHEPLTNSNSSRNNLGHTMK